MTKIENIKDISNYIINILSNNNTIIYIDLTNAIKISKTSSILYKTVPSLRTKIIINTKSIKENSFDVINTLIEILNKLYKLDKFENKLFITIEDKEIIYKIKILHPIVNILDNDIFYSNIKAEKNNKIIGVCLKD